VIEFLSHLRNDPGVVTCCVKDTLHSVLSKMQEYQVHRIFIVNEDNKPIGIITQGDVCRYLNTHFQKFPARAFSHELRLRRSSNASDKESPRIPLSPRKRETPELSPRIPSSQRKSSIGEAPELDILKLPISSLLSLSRGSFTGDSPRGHISPRKGSDLTEKRAGDSEVETPKSQNLQIPPSPRKSQSPERDSLKIPTLQIPRSPRKQSPERDSKSPRFSIPIPQRKSTSADSSGENVPEPDSPLKTSLKQGKLEMRRRISFGQNSQKEKRKSGLGAQIPRSGSSEGLETTVRRRVHSGLESRP